MVGLRFLVLAALAISPCAPAPAAAACSSDERPAIMALLDRYTAAISHQDRTAFETLLLGKDIPFSGVPRRPTVRGVATWRDYSGFAHDVFDGPRFAQRFRDVTIRQHGALADVDLIYDNVDTRGTYSGWKSMLLLKIDGQWKIASEFYTDL